LVFCFECFLLAIAFVSEFFLTISDLQYDDL